MSAHQSDELIMNFMHVMVATLNLVVTSETINCQCKSETLEEVVRLSDVQVAQPNEHMSVECRRLVQFMHRLQMLHPHVSVTLQSVM